MAGASSRRACGRLASSVPPTNRAATKEIRSAATSPSKCCRSRSQAIRHLARFQREAQVLASLNHPNIAYIRAGRVESRPRACHAAGGGTDAGRADRRTEG
jgi:hypothetical protein